MRTDLLCPPCTRLASPLRCRCVGGELLAPSAPHQSGRRALCARAPARAPDAQAIAPAVPLEYRWSTNKLPPRVPYSTLKYPSVPLECSSSNLQYLDSTPTVPYSTRRVPCEYPYSARCGTPAAPRDAYIYVFAYIYRHTHAVHTSVHVLQGPPRAQPAVRRPSAKHARAK